MMLPRVVRKLRKFSIYISVYVMLTIFMFTPVAQVYSSYILPRDNLNRITIGDGNSQITDMEIIFNNPNIKKEVRPSEVGAPYNPVTSASGAGNIFDVYDKLLYQESLGGLSLKFNKTMSENTDFIGDNHSYVISDLGYLQDQIEYDITDITAITDFYNVSSYTDEAVHIQLGSSFPPSVTLLAQGFEVKWDQANFTSANLYLGRGLSASADTVDLYLVSAYDDSGTLKPNTTDIISSAGPFVRTQLGLPGYDSQFRVNVLPNYDFADVTITKGHYFIVANYTSVDGNGIFPWYSTDTTTNTNSFFSIGQFQSIFWNPSSFRFTLEVELLPVDVSNNALSITDPTIINLLNNGTAITTDPQIISGNFVGFQNFTANTSVSLSFTSSYSFYEIYNANSAYSISNSTFDSMTCDWDLTWTSPEISTDYTLISRNQTVDVGADWTDAFNWLYNSTGPFSYEKIRHHYKIYLGTNTSAGNWLIDTTSPNHLYSAIFSDETTEADRYFLGYWTTDEVDATGFAGSEINLAAVVQSNAGSLVPDDTGTVTYSVYNSTGQIIPLKAGLPANILYTDTSSYSISSIGYTTPGNWDSQIIFDPSVYGTDQAGFWTAVVLWQNGTQIGFYTQRIIVQSQTYADYDWELSPGGDYGTADVTRQLNDNVEVRAWYYNISEPFLTGNGTLIPNVDISYSKSWVGSDSFIGVSSPYTATVLVDAPAVGIYTITLVSTGAFLENHTTSFDVTVFYQLKINPVSQYYATNYTNNGIFFMYLYDESAANNLGIPPDDMIITISNTTVNYTLTTGIDYTFTYQGAVEETWKLVIDTATYSLEVGSYDVFVAVQMTNYRANYTKEYASDSFVLDITAPKTEIQGIGGDTNIFSYHNATISFRFVDTNHTADITGATLDITFSAENIIYYTYEIGGTYYINIQNNNASLSSFTVFLDISKDNYESIVNFNLGVITVDLITTDLRIVGSPSNISISYPFIITVEFTDIDNIENITIAGDIYSIIINSTDYTVLSVIHWKDGLYNITLVNNDYDMEWLQISIEFGELGYSNSSDIIIIELVVVETDYLLISDSTEVIYYDQSVTITIEFWDNISKEYFNTTDLQIYSGSFASIYNTTYIIVSANGDSIVFDIYNIGTLGTYQLEILIVKYGYLPQLIEITIIIEERPTTGETESGETEVTEQRYADETDIQVTISFTDDLTSSNIDSAIITLSDVNGTLPLDTYFESYLITTYGLYYVVSFDFNDALAVGTTLIIIITIEKYGYVSQNITLTLVVYPQVTYDMDIDILGEAKQLETIQIQVSIENVNIDTIYALYGTYPSFIPNPASDFVNITYTFIFANGTEITYWILVDLELSGDAYLAITDDILIPWRVIGIKYSAQYVPSNEAIILAKATTEQEIVTESASFMALLTFLFQTYTPYMAAALAAIAVLFISLTIHFGIVRPRKQKRKAKKRGYLDKISKILTSVISMKKVIVVHNETGLPIYEWDLGGEISVDSSLVSGFLQAVSGMGGEISGGEAGAVRKIDYGQFCVSSAGTDCITTYLFSTGDISADVEQGLASFVDWFEKKFHNLVSTTWDGKTDEFLANERSIIDTLSENLFVWTLHPLSVNTVKEKDVLKLDTFSQRLYKFIKDYNEVSISVALEFFSKNPMEETLSKIFEMVDATILLRKRLR